MKLLSILFALFLFGCSSITTRDFDSIEYNYAVNISADATHAIHLCKIKNSDYYGYLKQINHNSFVLEEYVANKADSDIALPAVNQLRDISLSFLIKSTMSDSYCISKLSNVQASARMYARSIGYASKFDPCKGDVESNFTIFKKQYDSKEITQDEFKDLTGDLIKMNTIDQSGCTLETRNNLNKFLDNMKDIAGLLTL